MVDKIHNYANYICAKNVASNCQLWMDQHNSVGTATRYGMDGPGIESQLGARFSAPVQTAPTVHPASYTMGTG
jgi:hypothetical protein